MQGLVLLLETLFDEVMIIHCKIMEVQDIKITMYDDTTQRTHEKVSFYWGNLIKMVIQFFWKIIKAVIVAKGEQFL